MARPLAPLALAALLLAGCAAAGGGSDGPGRTPRPEEVGKVSPDRAIARALASGNLAAARKQADSLAASRTPGEKEAGLYWKALCLLHAGQTDSALAIFELRDGKWSGGLRTVHSQAFLNLARELSQAQARLQKVDAASQKSMQEKIDGLQKETGDLRAEIGKLETEKQKYEKLLKDLETIR